MGVKRTVNSGHDRLTRVADRALQFIEQDPDYREGDRIIVALDDGAGTSGLGLCGYKPPGAEELAAADMMRQLRAITKTGQPQIVPKATMPAGLMRPEQGGRGWLSRGTERPPT
jgi:hypothetical protein